MPSQEILQDLIDYNRHTGRLTWRERKIEYFNVPDRDPDIATKTWNAWNRRYSGKPAFTTYRNSGYVGELLGTQYQASRVAYMHRHGVDPQNVYYKNGVNKDLSIKNLVTSWDEVSESVRNEDREKWKRAAAESKRRKLAKTQNADIESAEKARLAVIEEANQKALRKERERAERDKKADSYKAELKAAREQKKRADKAEIERLANIRERKRKARMLIEEAQRLAEAKAETEFVRPAVQPSRPPVKLAPRKWNVDFSKTTETA